MNRRQNWQKVLDREVQRWSALPCDRLLSELSEVKAYEVEHESKTYQVEVEILVKTKDRVAWERTLRATHKGAFKGFPATGRPIVWRDMVISRFRNGLIAEDWVITDLAERLL